MPNSSPICIDANLVVRMVTIPRNEAIWQLWERWTGAARSIEAPILIRYEVANALHRMGIANPEARDLAPIAMRAALALPITLHTDDDLHLRALEFATRFNLPAAYDAHYLALADKFDAEFWTADRRLANAVHPQLPWVQLAQQLSA